MPVAGVMAAPQLRVVYPPPQHTTTAPQIFFIGTAPPEMPVTINGVPVGERSPAGHFAPSVPLQPGVWYHRLTGRLINETDQPARNIQIYYEIYAPNSNRIVDAGSTTLKSRVVNSQAEAEFLIIPNAAGRVKITLVEWLSGDRDYRSYPQMQEFP